MWWNEVKVTYLTLMDNSRFESRSMAWGAHSKTDKVSCQTFLHVSYLKWPLCPVLHTVSLCLSPQYLPVEAHKLQFLIKRKLYIIYLFYITEWKMEKQKNVLLLSSYAAIDIPFFLFDYIYNYMNSMKLLLS